MKTIESWRSRVRPAVAGLEPYVWEMSSEEVAARYGVPADQVIRFDTNTSPFLPTNLSPTLAGLAERMPLNEYPDTSYGELVRAITAYTGFPADQLVIGCGADEVLDMVAKTFVDDGTRCVVTQPSYGMYSVLVETYGGTVVPVPDRPDFGRDVEAIARAAAGGRRRLALQPEQPDRQPDPARAGRVAGRADAPARS